MSIKPGERLEQLRKKHKVKPQSMAGLAGVSDRQYRNYETGDSVFPLEFFFQAARLFRVTLDYLAGWSNEPGDRYDPDLNLRSFSGDPVDLPDTPTDSHSSSTFTPKEVEELKRLLVERTERRSGTGD